MLLPVGYRYPQHFGLFTGTHYPQVVKITTHEIPIYIVRHKKTFVGKISINSIIFNICLQNSNHFFSY